MQIDDLEKEIRKALSGYEREIVKGVTGSAKAAAENCKKILRSTSPKRTGTYARSWKVKPVPGRPGEPDKQVVYNEKHYRLTHLLELGHEVKDSDDNVIGHAAPHKHIEPAAEKAVAEFVEAVEDLIRGY